MALAVRAMRVRNKMAGARLRAMRERFDLSLEETGQALGLTAEEVLDRELGAKPLSVQELWRLCCYLGASPAEAYAAQAEPEGQTLGERALKLRRKLLGASLALRRQERNLSREEAAGQAGLPEEWLREAEVGEGELGLAHVELLAGVYGCDPQAILEVEVGDGTRVAPRQDVASLPNGLATDVAEFLQRPDAERYVRAAMALSGLELSALATLEDVLLFLRDSD